MGIDPANYSTSGWIDDLEYVGLNGRDQFDIGSLNEYSDFETGLAAAHGGADSRNYTLQDTFTYVTGGGAHTLKAGFTYNRVMVRPQRIGANDNGTFEFQHNLPFTPGNAVHLSCTILDRARQHRDRRARIPGRTGSSRTSGGSTNNLTLNLGLRYDYQDQTPNTKDAFGPRLGFAYDLGGDGTHGHSRRRRQVLRVTT